LPKSFSQKKTISEKYLSTKKVETHFPPLVQTLSYYLFINHLSKIPLWIKTKQLPEDKISKYFPVFFPTRSPGIFLFFYFLFNNKTKRRKREKSCFLLCADFFLGSPFLLFFIFITKLKEEEERKDTFPPLNKKRSFSPQGFPSRILPYPKVVKGEGENEEKFLE